MKITGYALREALKAHELTRDTAASMFDPSLKRWPDEEKQSPQSVVDAFLKAEAAIAALQTAQCRYNLAVTVEFEGRVITLAEAIKLVGGLARVEKMWRTIATPKKDRYGYDQTTRDPNVVMTVMTVSVQEAATLAQASAKRAGSLRALIATANAQSVEDNDVALSGI